MNKTALMMVMAVLAAWTTMANAQASSAPPAESHPYLGMWISEDGDIRHELLPNSRYDEQRGKRMSAYQGRYWIEGHRIQYRDDTGFSADGEFRDGVFHHGGYVFRREVKK